MTRNYSDSNLSSCCQLGGSCLLSDTVLTQYIYTETQTSSCSSSSTASFDTACDDVGEAIGNLSKVFLFAIPILIAAFIIAVLFLIKSGALIDVNEYIIILITLIFIAISVSIIAFMYGGIC